MTTILIAIYCDRCDDCGGPMEVYVAQEHARPEVVGQVHHRPRPEKT